MTIHDYDLVFGSGGGKGSKDPINDEDNLNSVAIGKILDVLSEGEITGFATPFENNISTTASNYQIEGQKDIFFNRTPLLKESADSTNVTASDYNFNVDSLRTEANEGTNNQSRIRGFSKVRSAITVPDNDLSDAGSEEALTISDTDGARIAEVVVIVGIPALFISNNKGDVKGAKLRFVINRSIDGGTAIQVANVLIEGRTNDLYQVQRTIEIPSASDTNARNITITVRKINPPPSNTAILQAPNSVKFMSLIKVIDQNLPYRNTALVGINIDAENFSSVPRRTYLLKGIKIRVPHDVEIDKNTGRIIYPTNYVFDGSLDAAVFCACPVFVLYDILTSRRYGFGDQILTASEQSNFSSGVAKNIDLFSFVEASKYANTLVSDRRTNPASISGTYIQSGRVITITFATNSGLQRRDLITCDFTSGNAVDISSPGVRINNVRRNKTIIIIRSTVSRNTNGNVTVSKGNTEPRFSFNGVINKQEDAFKLLNKVASVFRGAVYFSEGKIKLVCDKPADPVYLFNRSNVTQEGFSYEGSDVKTRSNCVVVKFFNNVTQQIDYVQHPLASDLSTDPFVTKYGLNKKQVEAFGCTSSGQASRLARFIYYSENFLTETCTFTTTIDAGVIVRPGMIISISDPVRSGLRLAGRITAASRSQITVDSRTGIAYQNGDTLSVILPDGSMETKDVNSLSGDIVTVASNFSTAPNVNSVWLYTKNNVEPTTWRIISIEQATDLQYTVTAVTYNSTLYNAIEGGTDVEAKDITALDNRLNSPSNLTIRESLYKHVPNTNNFATNDANIRVQLRVTWPSVSGAIKYKVIYRKGSQSIDTSGSFSAGENDYDNPVDVIVRRNEFELRNVESDYLYEFSVQSINAAGLLSVVPIVRTHPVVGKSAPPSDVANLTATIDSGEGVSLDWVPITPVPPNFADLDIKGYEIRKGTVFADGVHPKVNSRVGKGIRVQADSLFLPLRFVKETSTFMVKAYDTSGIFSTNATSTTVTINNPSAIVNPVVTAENGFILINWEEPSTHTYDIKRYRITFSNFGIKRIFRDSTELQTPGSWVGSTRTFEIAAQDMARNFGTSTSVAVTIPMPAAPNNLTRTFTTDSVVLKWEEAASAGALQPPVIGYRIYRNNNFSSSIAQIKGTEFTLLVNDTNFPNLTGTSYQVAAVYADPSFPTTGKPSTNRASVTVNITVAPAPSPSFVFELDFARVTWNEVNGSLPTIRYGVFEGSTLLAEVDSREFFIKADFTTNATDGSGNVIGTKKTIQVKAFSAAYINSVGDTAARAMFIGSGSDFTITRLNLPAPTSGSFTLGSDGGLGFVTSSWTPPTVNPSNHLDIKDFKIIRSSSLTFAGITTGNTELSVIQDTESFKEEVSWKVTGQNDSIIKYYYIVPRDLLNNEGAALKIEVEIFRPGIVPKEGTSEVIDNNVLLRWGEPSVNPNNQLKIDHYEIKKHIGSGAASQVWSTASAIGKGSGETITDSRFSVLFETKAGQFTYLIKAYDTAGNESKDTPIFFVTLFVAEPPDFILNADYDSVFRTAFGTYSQSGTTVTVTLSNHRFKVGDAVTLFPSSGTAVGDAFTERPVTTVADINTFTVTSFVSKNTSGNVTVKTITGLTEPQEIDSVAFTNCLKVFDVFLNRDVLYLPVLTDSNGNGTQTWAEHFIGTGSSSSPQFPNINALIATPSPGFTDYLEPAPTGASGQGVYQEVFDYGTELASSKVSSLATFAIQGNGVVNQSQRLDLASNDSGGTFSDGTESETNSGQRFGTTFRRVRYKTRARSVTGSLIKISNLNLTVDVKIKNDTGTGTASASDSGGTTVNFNVTFVDVQGIAVTPNTTSAVIAVVDFQDVPNPTSFKVLLYNTSGVRVSGNFTWQCRGT